MRSNWPATGCYPNLNVKNGGVFATPPSNLSSVAVRLVLVLGGAGSAHDVADAGHQPRHLHWEHELGRIAGSHFLQGVHVLEGHGVSTETAGSILDTLECVGEARCSEDGGLLVAFGFEDFGLSGTFGFEDFGLLLPFCDGDVGLFLAVGLKDHGATHTFCGHLSGHCGLDVGRRFDLSDLDVG